MILSVTYQLVRLSKGHMNAEVKNLPAGSGGWGAGGCPDGKMNDKFNETGMVRMTIAYWNMWYILGKWGTMRKFCY